VLLVDKPAGPTSHDVVARVRRTLSLKRVGHTGTLDPFASGLLVLCAGESTRLSEYLTGLDKEYLASVRLGQRTETHDSEGPVVAESERWRGLAQEGILDALAAFRGTVLQRPPRFSAKKVGGEAAHRRARRGEEVVLQPVPVTIAELELLGLDLPFLELGLRCSSGTYVRALARDLGDALGTGAHLTALRRTRVGRFTVEEAVPASRLEERGALLDALLPPASAVSHLPSVEVSPEEAARLAQGQAIPAAGRAEPGEDALVALSQGTLLAVLRREGARLRPLKVFGGSSR
jgi:tRNA pseudouridine55 synthase